MKKTENLPRVIKCNAPHVCYYCNHVIKKGESAIYHWWIKGAKAYNHVGCSPEAHKATPKQSNKGGVSPRKIKKKVMLLSDDLEFFDTVYLKTDTDRLPRLIVEVVMYPGNLSIYGLINGTSVSRHYREEFTKDKSEVTIIT